MRKLFPLALMAAACGSEEAFIVVTIDTQPAVHDVSELTVTLSNDGTSREDKFAVTSQSFPATFSISAPGRTGTLGIAISARDDQGILVGSGLVETALETPTARVLLDSADFVVNTDFAEEQFPSDDFESHGFQISATPDGTWTVVYRDRCLQPCNMFARRFDPTGRPVESQLAAGTNGFVISSDVTLGGAVPAVATGGSATVAVWDFSEPAPSTIDGIACRALDANGAASGPQVNVSLETLPDVVSVSALSNNTFAVSWNGFATENNIKGAIVSAQCQPSNVVQVSTNVGVGGGPSRGAVATNGDRIMYAWILDGEVRARIAGPANAFLTGDIPIVAKTPTEAIEFVRVAPLGAGFGIVVRWALITGSSGPGRLELYRTNNGGALQGSPVLVTTRSGTDFASSESFGVARSTKDDLLVVWHACAENGDPDSSCGVFGRLMSSAGAPVGEEFSLATTTDRDQTNPSAVALPDGAFAATWMDTSNQAPDKSGSAVRARIIYPSVTQPGSSSAR